MAQTGHIELSKAASLAHTWDCPGMGYASHCFCPFSLTARPLSISEFFPHQPYRDFVQALSRVIGAGAAISWWRLS
jgi:hypothetical protein